MGALLMYILIIVIALASGIYFWMQDRKEAKLEK